MHDTINSNFHYREESLFMRLIFFLTLILAVMPLGAALAALPPLLPMEDFFRNPDTAAFSIHPTE